MVVVRCEVGFGFGIVVGVDDGYGAFVGCQFG